MHKLMGKIKKRRHEKFLYLHLIISFDIIVVRQNRVPIFASVEVIKRYNKKISPL